MKKCKGFIITAGHLDIEWYQPMRSYRFWTTEALESLRDNAAPRDDFTCYVLDGQVYPLLEYLQVMPQDEQSMRKLIKDGKLAIGPFYTQFDEWMPSAENMMRNCLYGRRKSDYFGGYMRAGYLPDNFGHPYQLPQILQGFGIDSLMFMRGLPEIPGGHPDEFIYRGIDGSEVLVSHFRESYSRAFDIFAKKIDGSQPREVPYYPDYLSFEHHMELADHDDPERIAKSLIQNARKMRERYPSGIIPLIGGHDHLPPQINIGDSVKLANELQDEIEFVMGNAEEYVLEVQKHMKSPTVYDMELIGSMYQYVLLGALSTRSYLKQQNFACEALLERYVEPLDAIASRHGYLDRPALLDEAWDFMMVNSAHDSIHGSSVDETHIDMESRYGGVRQISAGIIHDALSYMGKRTKRFWKPTEKGILTYAPVGASFAQPHELWLAIGDRQVDIVGSDGKPLPTQILPREQIELNSIGMPRNDAYPDPEFRKVLFLADEQSGQLQSFATKPAKAAQPALVADDTSMENEHLRVVVADGGLIHILDKATDRWHYNLNLIEENADSGDAWDYAPTWAPSEIVRSNTGAFSARLIESGAVRATLEITGEMSVPAKLVGDTRSQQRVTIPLTYQISLYGGIRRVDVKLSIDNQACDHRFRLRVPTGLVTKSILSQGHLAVLDRPIERQKEQDRWVQPPTQLLPCREWISAQDGTVGLTVALKGMFDYEAVINPLTNQPDLYVTLLRGFERMGRRNTPQRFGAASPATVTHGAQCLGERSFEWSFAPYAPEADEKAPFLSTVQSYLYPPVAHALRSELEEKQDLPAPAFQWDAQNIQFSAFKKCYDRDGYILRLYENQGKQTRVSVSAMGFKHAHLADMNEQTIGELSIKSDAVSLTFEPYKAITIKFE